MYNLVLTQAGPLSERHPVSKENSRVGNEVVLDATGIRRISSAYPLSLSRISGIVGEEGVDAGGKLVRVD